MVNIQGSLNSFSLILTTSTFSKCPTTKRRRVQSCCIYSDSEKKEVFSSSDEDNENDDYSEIGHKESGADSDGETVAGDLCFQNCNNFNTTMNYFYRTFWHLRCFGNKRSRILIIY